MIEGQKPEQPKLFKPDATQSETGDERDSRQKPPTRGKDIDPKFRQSMVPETSDGIDSLYDSWREHKLQKPVETTNEQRLSRRPAPQSRRTR